LLNTGRRDPEQIQFLLKSGDLTEDEAEGGDVGIAFRVAREREGSPA